MKHFIFKSLKNIASHGDWWTMDGIVFYSYSLGPIEVASKFYSICTAVNVYVCGRKVYHISHDLLLGWLVVVPPWRCLRRALGGAA